LGPVRSVWSLHAKLGGGAVDPDTTVTVLTFDHGAQGYLGCSYVSPYTRWIRVAGERGSAIFAADGSLVLQRSDGTCATVMPPHAGSREEIFQGLLAGEIREFADCIRTGRVPEIDGAQGLRNVAVVLAAVESARRGAVVVVEEMLRVRSVE
jgi:myo-inositol 2-dehydrogenase / D-chiro-inositol 1-dehydrogenase